MLLWGEGVLRGCFLEFDGRKNIILLCHARIQILESLSLFLGYAKTVELLFWLRVWKLDGG